MEWFSCVLLLYCNDVFILLKGVINVNLNYEDEDLFIVNGVYYYDENCRWYWIVDFIEIIWYKIVNNIIVKWGVLSLLCEFSLWGIFVDKEILLILMIWKLKLYEMLCV